MPTWIKNYLHSKTCTYVFQSKKELGLLKGHRSEPAKTSMSKAEIIWAAKYNNVEL